MPEKVETPQEQIDRLATFIQESVPGEPSRSEGAVDTAIRLLTKSYVPQQWPGQHKGAPKPDEQENQ